MTVRVLVVDQGTALGGSVLVACALAREASQFGIEVDLATATDPVTVRTRLDPQRPIYYLAKRYSYDHHAARARRWRGKLIRQQLILWASWPEQIVSEVGYLVRLIRMIRRGRYDLVHLNNGMANRAAAVAALLTGRPFVVHYHGYCHPTRMGRWLARRAAGFVAISHSVAQSVTAIGARVDQITTLLNPLTVVPGTGAGVREAVRRAWGVPTQAQVFGIVGRVVGWKGQLEFLAAAERVLARLPGAWAVVIGDAADGNEGYHSEVARQAADPALSGRVVLTGYLGNASEIYAGLDLLVHSSIEPEPFGLVISEAMAAGVPVVASPRGAPAELIEDGVSGLLRDPADPKGVAAAVEHLLAAPADAARLATAARQRIQLLCDPERFAEAMANLYRGALT